jgi:hypothetical protein
VRASTNHALYVFSYLGHEPNQSSFIAQSVARNVYCARATFLRQAATLLRFAKQTGDPKLAAVLLDKAAKLNDKVEDVPLQKMDVSPQAPDMERQT